MGWLFVFLLTPDCKTSGVLTKRGLTIRPHAHWTLLKNLKKIKIVFTAEKLPLKPTSSGGFISS